MHLIVASGERAVRAAEWRRGGGALMEFHRFLMALSVRPGNDLTISDHRLGDRRRRMSDPAWHSLVGSTILCCHCRLNRCGAPLE